MESKIYLPLDKRTISVTNADGTISEIPALDEHWVEKRKFVYFAPPLISLDGKHIDEGKIDEWYEHIRFYIEDLSWIVGLPFHRFWSQLIYEKSSIQLLSLFLSGYTSELDDFLRYTIISDDDENTMKSDIYEKIIIIKDLIFKFLARLVTHSESEEDYIDRETLGKWLHQKELIKMIDIFYLCKIYLANTSLKNFIIVFFTINKSYVQEFRLAVMRIIMVLDDLNEQLKYDVGIVPLAQYRGKDVQIYKMKKLKMARGVIKILSTLWDISDNIITLCKMNSTFKRFFYSISFDVTAAKFFDSAFFNLSKYVKYFKNMEELKDKHHFIYKFGKIERRFLRMIHIITTAHSSKFEFVRVDLLDYVIDFMKRIDVFSGFRYFSTQYFAGVRIIDWIEMNSSPVFTRYLHLDNNIPLCRNTEIIEFRNRWNGAFFMRYPGVSYQQANISDRSKNVGDPPTQFEDLHVISNMDPETASLISDYNSEDTNYGTQFDDRNLDNLGNENIYIDSQGQVLHLCDSDEETDTDDDVDLEEDNFYGSEFGEYMDRSPSFQHEEDRDGSDSSEELLEELDDQSVNPSDNYGNASHSHQELEEINDKFEESEEYLSSSSDDIDFESSMRTLEIPPKVEKYVRREPPTEDEELALVAVVKEILKHLGNGFLRVCLQYYNYDTTNVIDAVLNDTLPPFLKLLDKDLEYSPSRDTITWKDDDVVMDTRQVMEMQGRKDVSETGTRYVGKVRDKVKDGDTTFTPFKKPEYQSYNEMYKQESSKYNVREMYEKIAEIYSDDEPSDTDFDMTKGSTLDQQNDEMSLAQLYRKGAAGNKEDERELMSEESEVEGEDLHKSNTNNGNYYRGRGGRGTGRVEDRRQKEKYKGRVGNHNRRNLADRKRKF